MYMHEPIPHVPAAMPTFGISCKFITSCKLAETLGSVNMLAYYISSAMLLKCDLCRLCMLAYEHWQLL